MKKHSGYRKRENNYAEITPDSWGCIIVIIIFSRLGWSAVQAPGLITNDSRDYIAFDTAALFQGQMINGRPPLYGMFLDLLEWIFGTRFLSAAVAIQMLLSLGTLILFAKILSMIEIGAPWKQIGVLLYGVSPGVVGWDSCILTESFSLSGTVLFLYLMIRYLKKREFAYAMGGLGCDCTVDFFAATVYGLFGSADGILYFEMVFSCRFPRKENDSLLRSGNWRYRVAFAGVQLAI